MNHPLTIGARIAALPSIHTVVRWADVAFAHLLKIYLRVFPRPRFADEDKTRVAAVMTDFYAIIFLYVAFDFAMVFKDLRPLGVQNYSLFCAILLIARFFAYRGYLKFSAAFLTGCTIYFYLLVTAKIRYFEHAQAANLPILVIYFTVTLGPRFGFGVLVAALSVIHGLYLLETDGVHLYPLSMRMQGLSRYSQEYRTLMQMTIEGYLFSWLVRSHIFSQLKTALDRVRTESRKAEEAREVADLAERKKSQYLIHVNHELRNPLTAIVTSVDMLTKEYASAMQNPDRANAFEKSGKLIDTINTTSQHLLSMLNDVLEMERLERGEAAKVIISFSLRKMVQDVAEIYAVSAVTAGCKLSTRLESGLTDRWLGQEPRIRQVLLNLVSNCIKHAPNSNVEISVSKTANGLELVVSDDGPGLSDYAKDHLFEAFASSLGAKGSTGLGLRICQLLVERQMDGSIACESKAGVGTAFTFRIPLEVDKSAQKTWEYVPLQDSTQTIESNVPTEQGAGALEGKKLLLVDDDEANLLVVQMALENAGLIVQSAQTAQDALVILTEEHFDFTLLDYNLGAKSDLNGLELAKRIVGGPAGTVVGYTGNSSSEVDRNWRKTGVASIIQKPASIKVIAATLLAAANPA